MLVTISVLLAAACLLPAAGKLPGLPKMRQSATHFGIPKPRHGLIGVAELAAAAVTDIREATRVRCDLNTFKRRWDHNGIAESADPGYPEIHSPGKYRQAGRRNLKTRLPDLEMGSYHRARHQGKEDQQSPGYWPRPDG